MLKNRGVSYWQAKNPVSGEACQKMVYMGTVDGKLFALDADSGKPCSGFANNGVLDLNQWNTVNAKYPLSVLQPPTVVGNHLLVGWAGKDWAYAEAPPGTVFSVNAQTGKLEWTFEAIPAEIRKRTGTANVWTHMSADEANGLVYLPVSSPSPNYWGGNRVDAIPLGTSTTALDINTGKVVWSRQWVHHDVWDYDINSAPTLMDITVDGKQIPALIQATKQGFLFVVNRLTGRTYGQSKNVRFRRVMVRFRVKFSRPRSRSRPNPRRCSTSRKNRKSGSWRISSVAASAPVCGIT